MLLPCRCDDVTIAEGREVVVDSETVLVADGIAAVPCVGLLDNVVAV